MEIRTAQADDGAAIAEIYAPFVHDSFISFEVEAPSADDMRARIQETTAQFPWLVAIENERVLGYAYAGRHRTRPAYRWSCDVSVYLGETARGRGVGRQLYEALFELLTRQGYSTAYAGIALPNDASVGFHEALGFEHVGVYPRVGFKQGSWRDVGWWHRPLQVLGNEPADPVPFRLLDKPGLS